MKKIALKIIIVDGLGGGKRFCGEWKFVYCLLLMLVLALPRDVYIGPPLNIPSHAPHHTPSHVESNANISFHVRFANATTKLVDTFPFRLFWKNRKLDCN